jgi:hypothetical protein
MERREPFLMVLKAAAITLLVHALVLWMLWVPEVSNAHSTTTFSEVGIIDAWEEIQPQSLEEQLRASLNEQVANLRSDMSMESSSERISSSHAKMSEEVKAELRAFEASEMARLASEKKDFGLGEIPEVDEAHVETLNGWDARYEGNVTVRVDLPGRKSKYLDVPGYRCQGGAEVVVQIVVSRSGEVKAAILGEGLAETLESCFAEAALKSARSSSFFIDPDAVSDSHGTLTYLFVPQ